MRSRRFSAAPRIHVYHLGNAAPRAYVANKLVSVDESSVIESGEIPEFDRSYEAPVDERSLKDLRGSYGRSRSTRPRREALVRIVSYSATA